MTDKLKELGFTEYEAKVFIAVLKGQLMSASEIADEAGVRRTDVYPILKSFVDSGYCNEIETNSVTKYEMIDPDVVMDKLKRNITKKRDQELSTLNETFSELKPLHKTIESEKSKVVNVELIRGYNQHREAKFIELLKSAKKEIFFMVRLEHFISDEIDDTAEKFIKKGGVIKSVYQFGEGFRVKRGSKWSNGTELDLIEALEKFESYGEKVRLSRDNVPNITIFDRETVFMNVVDKNVPRHNEADLIIRNKEFAKSMMSVFEILWESSIDLKNLKSTIEN